MKKTSTFSTAHCSNYSCPRLTAFTSGKIAHFAVPRDEAFRDDTGHSWCPECKQRGELMNWAYAHKWPPLQYPVGVARPQYAVAGGDHELWYAALILGKKEMIDCLAEAIAVLEATL